MRAMGGVRTSCGTLGFAEAGGGSALPIVFLHGVGSDKSVWRPQLEHFGRERRAIAFDYPGYGESGPMPGATRDDFAHAIAAGMDALAIPRAHICGLSLGGVVAIALHAEAVERCASLIIADSFAIHPDGQAIYERSVGGSRSLGMRGLAETRAGALLGSAATEDMREEVVETMARIAPDAYATAAEAVWLADQRERARRIEIPTLILCGEEDAITPVALSEELHRLVARSRVEIIAAAGHLGNLEQPVAFNSAIARFLAEIEANPKG